ncbi:hypothetical protein KCP74_22350 [Salmonella enterica subsp. enterica]|nr:hypothetical protein KCP74_22350 [Salmonella enterica subsp. enterica]
MTNCLKMPSTTSAPALTRVIRWYRGTSRQLLLASFTASKVLLNNNAWDPRRGASFSPRLTVRIIYAPHHKTSATLRPSS